ncbi:hypothetical protein, partial [Sideroxydans sp. CL21]
CRPMGIAICLPTARQPGKKRGRITLAPDYLWKRLNSFACLPII